MDPIHTYRRQFARLGDEAAARAATLAEFAAEGIKLRPDFRVSPPTFAEQLATNPGNLRILLYRPRLAGHPACVGDLAYHEFWLEAAVQWGYTTLHEDDLIGTPYEGRQTAFCITFAPGRRDWADQSSWGFLHNLLPRALRAWPEITTVKNNIGIYEPEIGAQIDDYLGERARHGI